jgi:hypothetical protein
MAIITTGSHPKHLWPGVYAFFGIAYESHGMEYPDLVDVRDSSKNYEEMVQNTGFGLAPQKGQGLSVSFDEDSPGVHRALHAHHLRPRLHHHPRGMEDNLYESVSMDRALSLKISMVETKENVVANMYNRGFNSSYTGGDGVCCSAPRIRREPATSRTCSPRRPISRKPRART